MLPDKKLRRYYLLEGSENKYRDDKIFHQLTLQFLVFGTENSGAGDGKTRDQEREMIGDQKPVRVAASASIVF